MKCIKKKINRMIESEISFHKLQDHKPKNPKTLTRVKINKRDIECNNCGTGCKIWEASGRVDYNEMWFLGGFSKRKQYSCAVCGHTVYPVNVGGKWTMKTEEELTEPEADDNLDCYDDIKERSHDTGKTGSD